MYGVFGGILFFLEKFVCLDLWWLCIRMLGVKEEMGIVVRKFRKSELCGRSYEGGCVVRVFFFDYEM